MVKDVYNEIFTEEGIKSPFNDFLVFQASQNKYISVDYEKMILKVYGRYNRILNLIVLLDKIEKDEKEDRDEMERYVIMTLHESLCLNFHSVISASLWFLKKFTKAEMNSFNGVLKFISSNHKLNSEEEYYLSLTWFDEIELILSSVLNNTETLQVFGGRKEIIQFQLYDAESEPIISASSSVMNDRSLISSVMYFSLQCLSLIKYFDLLMKYICIDHFSIKNYDEEITKAQVQKTFEDEKIMLDNYEEITRMYEAIFVKPFSLISI